MAKVKDSHSDMAQARQSDGINVIFDQKSPASSRSRSRSSGRSSGSGQHRGRSNHRGRYRSSSSSSSNRSSPDSRSRSHPRCHRPSSRCRCDTHYRYGRGRSRRSPPRPYRAHARSYSRSPSPDRYSHYRSRSRSTSRQSRYSKTESRYRHKISPYRTYRSSSKSRSSRTSVSLSLDDKRELLQAEKTNAMKILGTEKLELPESVKSILPEQPESKGMSPEPELRVRVRQDPEKTPSQSSEVESDDMPSPRMSPKRKIISFSINNSVVKPTTAAPSCAKVTPRVDIYESRKPYGHWVRVKSGQTNTRKHTLATLH